MIYQGSCLGKSLDKKMFGLYGAKTEGVRSLWLVKRSANKCFGPYFCFPELMTGVVFQLIQRRSCLFFRYFGRRVFFSEKTLEKLRYVPPCKQQIIFFFPKPQNFLGSQKQGMRESIHLGLVNLAISMETRRRGTKKNFGNNKTDEQGDLFSFIQLH